MKSRRYLVLTLACLLGLVLMIGSAVAMTRQHDQAVRGLFFGFPQPIDPPTRALSVNVTLEQYDEAQLKTEVAQIKLSGFTFIRQVFPWAQIEPEPGRFVWAKWDQVVQNSDDLSLIAVLDTAPLWASASNRYPPTSTLQFVSFAQAFAQRYGDRIDYYQIWDEPNLGDRWRAEVNQHP